MSRVRVGHRRRVLSAGVLALAVAPMVGWAVTPASAVPTNKGVIRGVLGMEGGAYPGTLRPTAGTVEVTRGAVDRTITVGKSGHFSVLLNPGKWTVTGCGGTDDSQCGPAQVVKVTQDHTVHIKLPWLLAP